MFGLTPARRPAARTSRPPVVRSAPAAFEPLESRQLMSASVAPADAVGLTVLYTKSTLPTAILTGTKVSGAVTLQLTNSAIANDTGVNTFTIYASTDAVVDAGDRILGTPVSKKLNLKAGKMTKITVPVKGVAAPIAGTYDILVSATDASGVVSTVEAPSLTVAPSFVSLSGVIGAATPTALTAGKTISFKVTLTNAGNTDGTGNLTAAIGLSTDGATVPISLTSVSKGVKIKKNGGAVSLTYKVKIPAGTATGTYFPAVLFTQGTQQQFRVFSASTVTIGVA